MQDIDLESLSRNYIDIAMEAAKENLSLNDFYSVIFRRLTEMTGLSSNDILSIHHPYHWILFLEPGHPLKIVDPRTIDHGPRVRIEENVKIENSELVSKLLDRYGTTLKERIRKICQKNSNTLAL